MKRQSKCNIRYEQAKQAKVGETITCACCGKEFVKRQWQQAFCCPKCKQVFWDRKGDRHKDPDYYTEYDRKHPERIERAKMLGYYGNDTLCVVGDRMSNWAEAEIAEHEAERRDKYREERGCPW